MADGGEVYTGGLAQRALNAAGARAMYIHPDAPGDAEGIIVGNSFDPSRAEDAALYAHERLHAEKRSGGTDQERDSEEIAARAVERFVFHQIQVLGMEPQHALRALKEGAAQAATFGESGAVGIATGETPTDPLAGYRALLSQGMSHNQIVHHLGDLALRSIQRMMGEQQYRTTDTGNLV